MDWQEIWIVGNGPSAFTFDLNRLEGKSVLVLNDAVKRVLVAKAVFSLDNNWVRCHRQLLESFPGEKYVALPLETWPECGGIPGVKYFRWSHQPGLSDDPEVLCTGCHSGHAAINLAYLKGSKLIHLVGYDLNDGVNSQYRFWANNYHAMLPKLREKNVKVLNHSLESAITAFERVI